MKSSCVYHVDMIDHRCHPRALESAPCDRIVDSDSEINISLCVCVCMCVFNTLHASMTHPPTTPPRCSENLNRLCFLKRLCFPNPLVS